MKNIFIFSLLLANCAGSNDLGTLSSEMDEAHFQLMEGERELVGSYFVWEEFQAGMKWELKAPHQEPYPTLKYFFNHMRALKDSVIASRGAFYAANDAILKSLVGADKTTIGKARKQLVEDMEQATRELERRCKDFENLETNYAGTLEKHKIKRITHADFGNSLIDKIIQYQDSLEEQGRIIGSYKTKLKQTGWEKTSQAYLEHYQPVSMMEKLHKTFYAQLIQVENQQNRYASSRQDEFFYEGPYMMEHPDIESTYKSFDALQVLMIDFRAYARQADEMEW